MEEVETKKKEKAPKGEKAIKGNWKKEWELEREEENLYSKYFESFKKQKYIMLGIKIVIYDYRYKWIKQNHKIILFL